MGVKTSLTIDSNLVKSVDITLKNWVGGSISGDCRKTECNIEDNLRSHLPSQLFGGGLKNCCGTGTGREDTLRFTYNYQHINKTSGTSWGSTCDYSLDDLATLGLSNQLSQDILYIAGKKLIAAELKVLSVDPYMKYINGPSPTPAHTITNKKHHFTPPGVGVIDKPTNLSSYFSFLAEGQLWMDILRLKQRQADERYLVLFTNSAPTDHLVRLEETLNLFDSKIEWIYHDAPPWVNNYFFRSKTVDFEYDYKVLPSGPGEFGYVIRIR